MINWSCQFSEMERLAGGQNVELSKVVGKIERVTGDYWTEE